MKEVEWYSDAPDNHEVLYLHVQQAVANDQLSLIEGYKLAQELARLYAIPQKKVLDYEA